MTTLQEAFEYAVGLDLRVDGDWRASAAKFQGLPFKVAAFVRQEQGDLTTALVWTMGRVGRFYTADGYWAFEKYDDARRFRLAFG